MLYKHALITATLLGVLCAPAWAINKCTGADGKVAFQDAACEGKGEKLSVRPASGDGATSQPTNSPAINAADRPKTEAQRVDALVAESQRKRRIQEYEVRVIPDAQNAISAQRAQCDKQQKDLKDTKRAANNNLAGATWEGSISAEMSAVATRCDTKDRELRENLDTLRKECQALGGCK